MQDIIENAKKGIGALRTAPTEEDIPAHLDSPYEILTLTVVVGITNEQLKRIHDYKADYLKAIFPHIDQRWFYTLPELREEDTVMFLKNFVAAELFGFVRIKDRKLGKYEFHSLFGEKFAKNADKEYEILGATYKETIAGFKKLMDNKKELKAVAKFIKMKKDKETEFSSGVRDEISKKLEKLDEEYGLAENEFRDIPLVKNYISELRDALSRYAREKFQGVLE
jgi:hypothetical protein